MLSRRACIRHLAGGVGPPVSLAASHNKPFCMYSLERGWTDDDSRAREYITRRGEDDPRILNWQWGKSTATRRRRSSTEGDNV